MGYLFNEHPKRVWCRKHQRFLRWLLSLPLLWRIAYRLITENLPHDESGTNCLVCEATARYNNGQHVATMNAARQLFCKKCGLPLLQWDRVRGCKSNGPKFKEPVDTSPIKIIPINWE